MKPKVRMIPDPYLKLGFAFGAVVFVHGDAGWRTVFGKPCVFYHAIYADSIDALCNGVNKSLPHAMKAAA